MAGFWALLFVLWVSPGAGTAGSLDTIRVYAIEPAYFDYVFTAIMSSSATNPVLSFNHRSGRTLFIHPGERLGEYGVGDFKSVIKKVLNPTIKMEQELKSGSVTLRGTNGPPVVLELGKRLSQPGWMAYLVNMTDGNWWYVKEGDTVVAGDAPIQIGPVASNAVSVFTPGMTNTVLLITEAETDKLAGLWESRARSRTEKKAVPVPEQDDTIFDPVPAVTQQQIVPNQDTKTVTVSYPSGTFFGTGYSYPTEYMVMPEIWSASGRLLRPSVVVPRRFRPRASGFSIEYHH